MEETPQSYYTVSSTLHCRLDAYCKRDFNAWLVGYCCLTDCPGSLAAAVGVGLFLFQRAVAAAAEESLRAFHDGTAAHLLVSRVRWWMIFDRRLEKSRRRII